MRKITLELTDTQLKSLTKAVRNMESHANNSPNAYTTQEHKDLEVVAVKVRYAVIMVKEQDSAKNN